MATLVRGRWVFADDGNGSATLDDGAVLVEGDRIAAVGGFEALRGAHPDADVLGSAGVAVLPGLINAHHHSNAVSHVQHGLDDDVLEPWILGNRRMRPMDPRLSTLIAAGRLLRTGVTSVVDMASLGAADQAALDNFRARLGAYEESGIRGHLAPGVRFDSILVHREDEAFVAGLPADLAARVRAAFLEGDPGTGQDYLDIMDTLIAEAAGLRRARAWYGPPGPQWVGDELMVRIADAAARHDVGIQTHVQESFYERLEAERALGRSMTAHLHQLGVLGPRLSFAHAVWSTESDIALLAETGTAIAHNPSSNLRLRSGVAPLNALLAAGVTVGLGMDGTTIGDDEDMFAEIRLALRLHRTTRIGGPAPTVGDIFGLATATGARLLRRETELGRIAPGFKADLALVDLERITWPYVAPEADPLALTLQRARAGDVRTVLVDGEVVLEEGRPTRFDFEAAARELAGQLAAAPYDRDFAALYDDLKPFLEAWYAGWESPMLEPWSINNSRM